MRGQSIFPCLLDLVAGMACPLVGIGSASPDVRGSNSLRRLTSGSPVSKASLGRYLPEEAEKGDSLFYRDAGGERGKKGTVYFSGTGGTGRTTKVSAPSSAKTTEVATWSRFLGCFREREIC